MHLKEQLYICTIAECGNITKAAEKLFITQPALSLYINNLEKCLELSCSTGLKNNLFPPPPGNCMWIKLSKCYHLQQEFEASLGDSEKPCRWGVAHWCPTPESTASSPHSHGPF
ncbi:MAG: LysR family transcriptional regulator [Enterocloster bolteae]